MFVITAILVLFMAALTSQAYVSFDDHDGCKLDAHQSTNCEKYYDCGAHGRKIKFRHCDSESPKNCGVTLETDGCCTFCPCRDGDGKKKDEGDEFLVGNINPHVKNCRCIRDQDGVLVARCKNALILPLKQSTEGTTWEPFIGKRRR
ncbi:uncharacterized protein LOC116604305 isoform X1 [Nematostella vectensis]|uniref:uncharacterized protein LOC116604305 isoform X1 n=1 Tax=Nematostella vectensis TaxID=45351 RepID=UPI00207758EC|nr:uncharacterized protein LOC116604305 isoform X1 [Nematostella vectensis]